ncbi:hypothetical protein Nepgr_012370 [Nepenthes gracilis]|uniref:Nucleolar complex protein 2 homolog n=1 Tax=Nepenthes gracilis TaxID=150966 RepID=A0AAD3XN24_NEPGR|nr:hypothetical protein Nepgr_012370 [Nepenthes gracilis]
MGKLGKKARKFAKKNLQSVLRRKRKLNSMFKKKNASRDDQGGVVDQAGDTDGLFHERSKVNRKINENLEDASLNVLSSEDDIALAEDVSDSDGFLSEDSTGPYVGDNDSESFLEENDQDSALSLQNQKVQLELEKQMEKLERLRQKYSDEDGMRDHVMQSVNGYISASDGGRLLTSSIINSWCQTITRQQSFTVLPCLLNAYRAACHYGAESTDGHGSVSSPMFQNSETFVSILMFMLREGDGIFRSQLNIPSNNFKIEGMLKFENTLNWKQLKPMVKSYLRSTLFLLNQLSDTEILAYSLTRLRASIMFFAAFPSLLHKLIQVAVNLWTTGGGTLSSCSFLIISDVASFFGSDFYDVCLKKMYRAFMGRCRVVEPMNIKDVESLRDSFLELCSMDLQKSVSLAMSSIQKLARIFQLGLKTKKEVLKKICSLEYVTSIDLWVAFVSANIRENDFHGLLLTMIQIINGIAYLFPGPRYLPLRIRCIQWLNRLSSSSGIFIPVSSLVLDILEYKTTKEVGKSEQVVKFPAYLKLPKHLLKLPSFQEECVFAAIELLSIHLEQWSYHVSFPELATIPNIRLRKFQEKLNVESLCHMVKRFIDQVEKNVDFVEKKRDQVSFVPKGKDSVDSFLQMEKSSGNTTFTQFYRSVVQKAALRRLTMGDEKSLVEQTNSARRKGHSQSQKNKLDKRVNGHRD